MNKEIIIFKENGFFCSPLIPKDFNGDLKRYAYFDDIAEVVKKILKKVGCEDE